MCGIAAIFAYRAEAPSVSEEELLTIRDRMRPRGPDGEGLWLDSSRRIGLAHRRLSILDLSPAGSQPMHLATPDLRIVFNGEIYNYRELRAQLEAQGHQFFSHSDTEVLLHLYAVRGESMLHELRGMYAFALWDEARQGLFLARDPYGIKPLYLADDGQTLRVASQVKALLASGRITTSADAAGRVGFFLWGHVPEPYTLYRSIRSLPPGGALWLEIGGARRQCTSSIPTETLAEAECRAGQNGNPNLKSALGDALNDSVRCHLIADVPVGVFLSSGLDSTSLACLAAQQGGTLRTVTLGFEEYKGSANDETPLAEAVARKLNAQHQTVWVTRGDFQSHVDRLFDAMDQPSTDGVNTYFVSLAAQRASLKVALSGLGGDELLGGYPSFRQVPRITRALGWLGGPNRLGRAVRVLAAPWIEHFTSPKYAGLLEYGGSFGGAYLLRRGLFMPWELPAVLDPDLVREGWEELQPLVRLEATLDGLNEPWLKVACLEASWYMRNQLLRDSDWAGMAHSLEIRVPLVDLPLLRSVAPLLVYPSRPTKRDMASVPRLKLPDTILNRRKTGFTVPVRDWLLAGASPSASHALHSSERGLRGWARLVYQRFTAN